MNKQTEVWLRGPLKNVPALLQPVAHALLQAKEEINELMQNFADENLWQQPAGIASPAFHLQHITGVLDRLFAYAQKQPLSETKLIYLNEEGKYNAGLSTQKLLTAFNKQVDIVLQQLIQTNEKELTDFRSVGRAKLPSTLMGLLFHAAEHTMRHTGQLTVTIRIINAEKQER